LKYNFNPDEICQPLFENAKNPVSFGSRGFAEYLKNVLSFLLTLVAKLELGNEMSHFP
jgi:hypothetical protein